MKTFTKFLILIALALGIVSPQVAFAAKTDVEALLKEGGVYRIKNRGSNNYLTEVANNNGLMGRARITTNPNLFSQVWILTPNINGFTLRNASTGRYVPAANGNPMTTTFGAAQLYIRYSKANTNDNTNYVSISWNAKFEGNESLNENYSSHNVLGWKANSPTVNDNFSDWIFEKVEDVSLDDVKAHLDVNSGAMKATDSAYVRVVNMMYGTCMTEVSSTNGIVCIANDQNDYGQVWRLIKNGEKWHIQNALTGRYIKLQNGERSQRYNTVTVKTTWQLIQGVDPYLTTYGFEDAAGVGLHCDANANVVGWDVPAYASQWMLQAATIDEAALKAAQDRLATYALLSSRTNVLKIRNSLKAYFSDLACTTLKPEFQAMSDADLTAFMSKAPETGTGITIALPSFIQDIVLKVKNNTWGHREKEFRVYDYQGYSDPSKWNAHNLVGTGYPFSPQTGPTGVSVKRNDVVFIFVGSNIPVGTTLHVMNCSGMDIHGTTTRLEPGFNVVNIDADGHLFINYVITNTSMKLASVPKIPIHIQGGYVNGYFDITRGHTNADWTDMARTLFRDEIIHMKNRFTQFNVHLAGVKRQLDTAQFNQVDVDGTPKGIVGVLMRWDQLVEQQRNLIHAPQFYDRFNCYMSASSSSKGNPYASSFGTYYPGVGSWMNYDHMTRGGENDEGGNFWMIAHECGHNNQMLINLPGDTEMSVNFFSQVNRWFQGSNVGRGRPLSNTMESFHNGHHYQWYNLWQRSRMYFQLWLYYEMLGHKPGFWNRVFDMMRKKPMVISRDENSPSDGTESYFRFAEYCSEAAGEDLTEFFEFYGFFRPKGLLKIDDYGNRYINVTQKQIDACKARLALYPEKAHPGIMFIDERIRRIPATYPGARSGVMRLGTSGDATPGDASEVGEVGHVYDFDASLKVAPYTATLTGNTVRLSGGRGAVGFKVYDTTDKLVYVANTHVFTIPADIAKKGYYVKVAYGNGTQQSVLDKTGITSLDHNTVVEEAKTPEVVYDLDGLRCHRRSHGVQIVNGKTVVK